MNTLIENKIILKWMSEIFIIFLKVLMNSKLSLLLTLCYYYVNGNYIFYNVHIFMIIIYYKRIIITWVGCENSNVRCIPWRWL